MFGFRGWGFQRYGWQALWVGMVCGVAAQGCSRVATGVALQSVSAIMANGLPAYAREADLELAAPALAANIKLVESLLESAPEHPTLLLFAAQGLATYAYAVAEGQLAMAQGPQQIDRHTQRTSRLYQRGLQYGLRLLSRRDPVWLEVTSMDMERLQAQLSQLSGDDAPALFWTVFCWGGVLNMTRDALETLTALPRFEAMAEHLITLDPTYFYGAPHLLLAVHYASRTPALGGKPEVAQRHFARARELSQERLLLGPLLEAQHYAVQVQDRGLFEARLQEILQAPETLLPEQGLLNQVSKQRAQLLLQRIDDLFL